MGLPRLLRRSTNSWFVLVINALLVGLFCVAWDCVSLIRLAFSSLALYVLVLSWFRS